METAPIADLKARLSRFLKRVQAGEEILVTDRGTPVARLVPVRAETPGEEPLAELERLGQLRRGTGRLPQGFWSLPRPGDASASVRRAVSEEREEGR